MKATGIVCSKMVTFVLALMILVPSLARAVMPETGVYYNSLRQGLGYYVEVQGTTLVMLAFAYDQQSNKPLFYYASGTITKSKPGRSKVFDPSVEHIQENAYQFIGKLYKFDTGPCITCDVKNWDTSKHAHLVGQVFLRFADVDNMYVGFNMNDGTAIGTTTRRLGFGRQGFNIRSALIFLNNDPIAVPQPIAGFTGTWVFSDLEDLSIPPMRFDFDKAVGPLPKSEEEPNFGASSGPSYAQFTDTKRNSVLTCSFFGCGLQVNGETILVFKYWDIGSDAVLAYSGAALYGDGELIRYRGEHLISGIRITDPIPDAPPPPTDSEGQP